MTYKLKTFIIQNELNLLIIIYYSVDLRSLIELAMKENEEEAITYLKETFDVIEKAKVLNIKVIIICKKKNV